MIAQAPPEDTASRLEPYGDGLELLADLLARLDDRLRAAIDRLEGPRGSVEDPHLPGLVVTAAEVRRHFDDATGHFLPDDRGGPRRPPRASASPEEAPGSARPACGLWESVATIPSPGMSS